MRAASSHCSGTGHLDEQGRRIRTILDTRRYATATFRCDQCGFLASFATAPLTDG